MSERNVYNSSGYWKEGWNQTNYTKYKDDQKWNGTKTEWQRDWRDRDEGHKGGYDSTEGKNIWIGGLPKDITDREVERVCSKFGPVEQVSVKQSPSDTYVFVNFKNDGCAPEAIEKLDQSNLFGNGVVKCAPANKKPEKGASKGWGKGSKGGDWTSRWGRSRSSGRERYQAKDREENDRNRSREKSRSPPKPRCVRIYLSQLPRDMEEDELQEITNEYGKVLKYELHREGAYKCGWVEYASKKEADLAVKELDDRRMDEWNMRLQAYMYPGGA